MLRWDLLALCVSLAACGNAEENGAGTSDSGSTSSASDSTSTAASTTGNPGNDLSGTWDLIVSNADGDASTSTIALSPTLLQVSSDEVELLALVADELVDIAYNDESVRAERQTKVALDLGVLPLPLGGLLHFVGVPDDGESCDFGLDGEELTLLCTDEASGPSSILETDGANLTARRTDQRSSVFGVLGGTWRATADGDACDIVFEGSTITATCDSSPDDSVVVTVGDGRITGVATGGIEFTAQRR